MLVQEGDSRSLSIDLLLASVLSFVAGGVNGAGYLVSGYLSANMTGNVSMISDHLSLWQPVIAAAFLAIVIMFIFGAFVASLLIQMGKRRNLSNIYALTLLAEAFLLMVVGLSGAAAAGAEHGFSLVAILSFTMGIQNAASTTISGNRLRTTHVSGIATDIGVGFALLLGSRNTVTHAGVTSRLTLHFTTILSFIAGGIAGVYCYGIVGSGTFSILSLLLLAMCARYLRLRRNSIDAGGRTE